MIVVLLWAAACTTEKNTPITRAYHNLTAHYNVYFNGEESLKKGIEKINKNFKDNYSTILPVFKYGDEKVAGMVAGDMDRVIKKASKCINTHSITVKPKHKRIKNDRRREKRKAFEEKVEYCNWVDDSYLLMGKAHFYTHNFYAAIKSFRFIEEKYKNSSVKHEAMLWLAKAYNQLGDFRAAEEYLNKLENDVDFPEKELGAELYLTHAEFFLKQGYYKKTIPQLEQAIEKIRKKRKKARYIFILAQINQKLDNPQKASELYADVVKMNPPYEMAFNAKINRAVAHSGKNTGAIERELKKMLKDDKNIEYQDQIYFGLANIYYKKGDTENAIKYYKKSVRASIDNVNQKAMSCLSLADIYFDKTEYETSAAYYDSTMTFLSKDYPEYDAIERKARNLTKLVENLNVVTTQDSLQRWAAMGENERAQRIKNIIEEIKAEERRIEQEQRMAEMQRRQNYLDYQRDNRNNRTQSGGKWYFYNPISISIGQTEFQKKWGRRKLEDHWRRRNKTVIMGDNEMADANGENNEAGDVMDNKSEEYYLKDLPTNDSLMAVSNDKIEDALFNVGEIYFTKIEDYPKAIEAFEELLRRFPDTEFKLEAFYKLYLLYEKTGNTSTAELYKGKLISQFPHSRYAKMFTNPDYLDELRANKEKIENLYAQTMRDFQNEKYSHVISRCKSVQEKYPNNHLETRFVYLKTVSYGAINAPDTLAYMKALEKFIEQYPSSDMKDQAELTLEIIRKKYESRKEAEKQIYFPDDRANHFYIFVLRSDKINMNQVKFKIAEFNADVYLEKSFNQEVDSLNENTPLLVVKQFENKNKAMEYYRKIAAQTGELFSGLIPATDFNHFVISEKNYAIFIKDKRIDKYMRFFDLKYKM